MDRYEKNIYCEDPILCRIFAEYVDHNLVDFVEWLLSIPELNAMYVKQLKKHTCKIDLQLSPGG